MNFKNFSRAQYSKLKTGLMALESSGMILYVAKISYQSDNWFGNSKGGPNFYTDTYTQADTHTHTEAHFIGLVFLRKCRNKTKN